tara:strand:+ start:126 stop:1202 length:1077 start_codon:yes stop_codon:yes gene_type:complete
MKHNIKKFIEFIRQLILEKFFFKEKIYFYKGKGVYSLGSLNFFRNLILNIMYPGRFIFKFIYKQAFKKDLNSKKYFEKKIKILSSYYPDYFNQNKIDQLRNCLEKLNKDGAFILEEYFSKNQIDLVKQKYSKEIKDLENNKNNEISYNYTFLKMNKLTKSFFYDPGIVLVIESFYQSEIYARNYPVINHTSVPKIINENTISKTADNWHVDHTNLGSMFVFMEDVPINGTRMQYLPGTHKHHHIAGHHSNEQYEKKKKGECFGKQGTVHFHSGNIVHRAKINPGYDRWSLNFEYSIGSNILLNSQSIAETLSSEFDITNDANLNSLEKKFLKGIYPNILPKGYEIINDKLIPTRYKGI